MRVAERQARDILILDGIGLLERFHKHLGALGAHLGGPTPCRVILFPEFGPNLRNLHKVRNHDLF